ncbi:MAG: hypothetical protein M2R45_01333 [Verrucomicrobia subdivision 3 bacterium]|nr:hypothetical protein [Limisphaerales bacterium]MCS1415199.1 hypothetical protein [Limisphaerales bacterium]
MTYFEQLLEATIRQVERLRQQQVRYLPVSPELVRALEQPLSQPERKFVRKDPPMVPVKATPAAAPSVAVERFTEEPFSSTDKVAAIDHLRERALACVKCPHLVRSRRSVVFGVGSIDAVLMFVGEAPGVDEDAQGEPFVGKAGQLLTRIIETMGLSRETVYIANVLKCRPDTPGRKFGNRKPTPQEMVTCRPYLMEQIRMIQPKVIVALGATAVEGLMGLSSVGITKYRGQFREFGGIPMMPTYHPSYVLRNQSHRIKRQIWEDMLQVMERLSLPVSEKQRGYFAKGVS